MQQLAPRRRRAGQFSSSAPKTRSARPAANLDRVIFYSTGLYVCLDFHSLTPFAVSKSRLYAIRQRANCRVRLKARNHCAAWSSPGTKMPEQTAGAARSPQESIRMDSCVGRTDTVCDGAADRADKSMNGPGARSAPLKRKMLSSTVENPYALEQI